MAQEPTPKLPYMLRAIYEWINDNGLTAYMSVNAMMPGVMVPQNYVQNGMITLNIRPDAVKDFHFSNEAVMFSSRFNKVSVDIVVPIYAIMGIFPREFPEDGIYPEAPFIVAANTDEPPPPPAPKEPPKPPRVKLSIVPKD